MKINLLGSGYMGKQICSLFVILGYDVIIWQNSAENLDDFINTEINKLKKVFNISPSGTFKIEKNLDNLEKNFTIETLADDLNIKKSIISKLKFKDNIFSNTSSLSAQDLGNNINILHFMNPITTPIIEIYKTQNYTNPDFDKIIKSLKNLSYNIIEVKNVPGFLVNRILFKNISYFFYLLENEKNNIEDLRKIYKNIFNNDPIKIVNMIGLDTCLNILRNLNKSDKSIYVSKLITESVNKNVLGYKNKKLLKV